MKKGYLLSSIIGIFFFIILYVILEFNFIISFFITLVAYFAAFLIIKNVEINDAQSVVTPANTILNVEQERIVAVKKAIAGLYQFAINSKDENISNTLKSICNSAEAIEKLKTSSVMIREQKNLLLNYFLNVAYNTAKDYLSTDKVNPEIAKKISGTTLIIEREIDFSLKKFIELRTSNVLMDVKTEINSFKEKVRKL